VAASVKIWRLIHQPLTPAAIVAGVSRIIVLLLAVVGCVSSPAGSATPQPTPAPQQQPQPQAQAPAAKMGEPCPDGACADGLACVRYYGIAGSRGPEFSSCELRCKADGGCPPAHSCTTIADGPGRVCRPSGEDAARAPAADPPFAALASARTFFIVEVERGKPRCQPWTVAPDARTLHTKRSAGKPPATATADGEIIESFAIEVGPASLTLHGLERTYADGGASTECQVTHPVAASAGGISVTGATWFDERAACETAIRERWRVAMPFGCELADDVPDARVKATRKQLDGVLQRGGALFSIVDGPRGDTCKRVRVIPDRAQRRGTLAGRFAWDVRRDDGVRGTTSLGYTVERGEERMAVTGPDTTWRDGSSMGLGCLGFAQIDPREDHVMLDDAMYFTERACKAAITEHAAHAAWLPPSADDDADVVADARPASEGSPAIGGC
jgi:hypothetical protein